MCPPLKEILVQEVTDAEATAAAAAAALLEAPVVPGDPVDDSMGVAADVFQSSDSDDDSSESSSETDSECSDEDLDQSHQDERGRLQEHFKEVFRVGRRMVKHYQHHSTSSLKLRNIARMRECR